MGKFPSKRFDYRVRCFICKHWVKPGQAYVKRSNGVYSILAHTLCDRRFAPKRKS